MYRLNARLRWFVGLAVILIVLWLLPLPIGAESSHRTIQIDAHQFEFTPGRIEVSQGDVVTIRVTASDVVHGFYLDGYSIQQAVTPGISEEISFIADQPGKFRFRCSVSCGTLHPFMIGELVVNSNIPLWRAAATVGASLIGILFYLWHFGRKE